MTSQTRRQFLQDMAALAGAAGLQGGFFAPLNRAVAIEPDPGTSYLDAEHVVILMQENRSFDHTFGTLRGVRGFNDPRFIQLPSGDPVWVQSNRKNEKFIPFRMDLKESRITWMGALPHSWPDQTDAANGGKHDLWLEAKRTGHSKDAEVPLTMGYHTREDLPFYYALADAFTVCDQNFCSSLTETTPNRLHLWTGTNRPRKTLETPAIIRNRMCSYANFVSWPTVPDWLEDHGISWKIYQNELTVPTGLPAAVNDWMGNFGDNPIEWFTQFHVRHHPQHREFLKQRMKSLQGEIRAAEKKLATQSGADAEATKKQLTQLRESYARDERDTAEFSPENFARLPLREQYLHQRAFTTNVNDPGYRQIEEFRYPDGDQVRSLSVPKGDVLHQFREDVQQGKLPTVSWLVPSARFSDHPSSAWYGQWYLSEILNILTSRPEVWKKTIFILTYDENDGYYDHIPPFQAPHPKRPETGKTSAGLETSLDFLVNAEGRDNSLGLGFRVPMIIASPWTRGGCVCSQVFDHTSVVRFLQKFASHKIGKPIEEGNITDWRKTICGDLTSAFQTTADAGTGLHGEFLERNEFIETIHRAQFKQHPAGYHPLTSEELQQIQQTPQVSLLPRQEPGTRRSAPLPYELAVNGSLQKDRDEFQIRFEAGNQRFGDRSSGAPLIVYAHTREGLSVRFYAARAGSFVEDAWPLSQFDGGRYQFRIYGPNGFYREFSGEGNDPLLACRFEEGNLPAGTHLSSQSGIGIGCSLPQQESPVEVVVTDLAYGNPLQQVRLASGSNQFIEIDTTRSNGWYDVRISISGRPGFQRRYAGRIETGLWSTSDPAMA